jgi:hypothetical protein
MDKGRLLGDKARKMKPKAARSSYQGAILRQHDGLHCASVQILDPIIDTCNKNVFLETSFNLVIIALVPRG